MEEEQKIFKEGSRTYYYSSRFFPKAIRNSVFKLYSFVRVADDYIDGKKADAKKLLSLEKAYQTAITDHAFDATAHRWDDVDTRVVKNIVRLQHRFKFDDSWVPAFFSSMKMDISPKPFKTIDESLQYVYGSAEVIGLMMAKIMKLPEDAYEAAKAQGRAMQWVNFIRDIKEDNELGRAYFPTADLKKFGLKNLTEEEARANPEKFKKFIHFELDRYKKWQAEATKGMTYIPERLKVPIKTAVDMYNWTALQIEKDPFVVYERKVRPRKRRVLTNVIRNTATSTSKATVKAARKIRSGTKQAVPAAKAAVPVVKEKAAETTDTIIQKTEEIRDKLPGNKS